MVLWIARSGEDADSATIAALFRAPKHTPNVALRYCYPPAKLLGVANCFPNVFIGVIFGHDSLRQTKIVEL